MGLFDIFKRKLKDVDDKHVFDKAKYHFESVEQLELDESQAYVHTGLFFAWLVNHGLMSDFFIAETKEEIEDFKAKKISPAQLYMNWDGVLIGELLNKEGFNFALAYFDFENGGYISDYEQTFNLINDNIFGVADTWNNYDKLEPVINAAYAKWKK